MMDRKDGIFVQICESTIPALTSPRQQIPDRNEHLANSGGEGEALGADLRDLKFRV
jgi:hypothetical protein